MRNITNDDLIAMKMMRIIADWPVHDEDTYSKMAAQFPKEQVEAIARSCLNAVWSQAGEKTILAIFGTEIKKLDAGRETELGRLLTPDEKYANAEYVLEHIWDYHKG